ITHWFEGRRGMAVGIVGSGQAIAGAVWPAIFQSGIADVGWRETSLWYGVFALLTMIPAATVFARQRPQASAAAANAQRKAVAQNQIPARTLTILLCTAIVGCCVAMSLPLAHLLSHASDIGYSALHGARLLSLMLVCAAISSMVGIGMLSARLGPIRSLMVFSGMQAATLGLFPLADSLVGLYVVAALFGLGYGGVLPTYPIIIREHTVQSGTGARTGLVVFFGTIGMAMGSGLGGLSFDQFGSYAPAFYTGVVFNVGNLLILGYIAYRLSQKPLG
ncbi:MAG: MFS transporter, partial [Chromatiales bacterium]|nr:MFS transporter [Chromatiales bacterium]